jgi:outer membrane protein assembly factor BamA
MSKVYLKYIYYLLFTIIFCFGVTAQTKYVLKLSTVDNSEEPLTKIRYPTAFNDSLKAIQTIKGVISSLHSEGYLLAALVTLNKAEDALIAKILIGEKFEWLRLSEGNLDRSLLRRSGFKEAQFKAKPFRFKQVARLEKFLLTYAERNGFPFASLKLDSLNIEDGHIGASLNLDLGPLIKFDSLDIKSDFTIKSRFLGSYLGINQNKAYDQRKIDYLAQRIRGLPYLRLSESPELTFQNAEATVHLVLEKRPVNQIDAIIGFLPNSNRSNQLLVTGQVDIDLLNPFGSGKQIGLHWRRLSEETQTLNLQYAHPNLLGSPLNFEFGFDFLKQDTLFTKRNIDLRLGYNLEGNINMSVFSKSEGTDLIGTPQLEGDNLPNTIDFDLTSYGFGFTWNNLNDPFIPSRGTGITIKASTGNKKIQRNNALPSEIYDKLDLRTLQYTFEFDIENYWRWKPNFVLVNKLSSGLKINDQLFENDAFRLGGLNSLRGFNENIFFASQYALTTIEGRLLFDENSYLLLFSDLAYIAGDFQRTQSSEVAFGIGAGLSFATTSGVFNFIYAIGSAESTGGFNFNQSKIHFGYTTRF